MVPIRTEENLINDKTYEKTLPQADNIESPEKLLSRKMEEIKNFAEFLMNGTEI